MTQHYLQNAINIFNLEIKDYKLHDIKTIYRQLAKQHHPDFGGDTEIMQLINNSYDKFIDFFANSETLSVQNIKIIDFAFIEELKKMEGVLIEICSEWIWLTGNTIKYKEEIKNLKFRYSGTKKSWYWSPTIDTMKFKRTSASMQKIRRKYGSEIINNTQQARIN